MIALRLLAALWMSPITILWWCGYILPALALGWIKTDGRAAPDVVRFLVVEKPGWHWEWWKTWAGWCLPHAILLRARNPRHEKHELWHHMQRKILGPFFPLLYLVLLLVYGYRDNPLERDAREWADKQSLRH